MKIHTTRFGEIEINESDLIFMKRPILGFDRFRKFVLLIKDEKTPLGWLQSVDDPSIAFVVVSPRTVKPDYRPEISGNDLDFLDFKAMEDAALLAIVTVRSHPMRITANLKAPILVNAVTRTATQTILEGSEYAIQYDIMDNRREFISSAFTTEASHTADGLGILSLSMAVA